MTSPAGPAGRDRTPPGLRWGDLLPRIGSALVMIALALGTAFLGGQPFALFWLAVAAIVVWEWQRLIGPQGARARTTCGVAGVAAAVPLASSGLIAAAGAAVVLGAAAAAAAGREQRGLAALGVLYGGALAVCVVLLRGDSLPGLVGILWLFAVVWGTDIVAYFAGRLIGGPRLSPRWSPKKTWSGLAAGVMAGALLGAAVSPAEANHAAVLAVGCIAGLVSQAGDIAESALKRRFHVKDASSLIPGHGGVMDRVDGFAAAAIFAFALGAGRAGVDAAALGLFNWP